MTHSAALEAEALRLRRERERRFPAFVRRMTPDALDRASGAWDRVLAAAAARLGRAPETDRFPSR